VLAKGLEHHLVRRQIRFRRDFPHQLGVLEVIEVMPIRIKHAVPAKPERLMDLKVKADRSHVFIP
jgi:hypothetical protein